MRIPGLAAAGLALATFVTVGSVARAQETGPTVSVWGGYFATDAHRVIGYADLPGGPAIEDYLDVDEGWFGGVSIGTPLAAPGPLPFDHVEFYFEGQQTETDSNSQNFNVTGIGALVLGVASCCGIGNSSGIGKAELKTERYEFGARLHLDQQSMPTSVSVTPFVGFGSQDQFADTISSATNLFVLGNDADVDWWFLGTLLEAEHGVPLGNGFTLLVGVGGGPYLYDADGKFSTSLAGAGVVQTASNYRTGIGFRGQGSVKLVADISERAAVSLFGMVDYWSDVPYADMPSNAGGFTGGPARVGTDDVVDYKAGVKLTIDLGR